MYVDAGYFANIPGNCRIAAMQNVKTVISELNNAQGLGLHKLPEIVAQGTLNT